MIGETRATDVELASVDSEREITRDGHVPTHPQSTPSARERWPYRVPMLVLVVGLLVTGALALVSRSLYDHNEKRLLELRVRELGSLLLAGLPNRQTELASAVALADATNGNITKFERFVAPYVGSAPSHPFVSVSLWRLGPHQRGPLAVVGSRPLLGQSRAEAAAFFARAQHETKLSIIGLRRPALVGLGYAFATPVSVGHYVAYGENDLATDRRSRLERNSAFSDLDYALYLGNSLRSQDLLVTSLTDLPIRGQQARLSISFGDTVLTLVVSPRQALAGALPARLPGIIAIVGAILSLGAAALTTRLVQRRRGAEHLAGRLEEAVSENQRLYAEQRTIAQTLQHALLPDKLPNVPGGQATVLCTLVDVGSRQVTVASAGHLPPLLISGDGGEYLESEVGLPIGVQSGSSYTARTVSVPPAATLLAFTDGLIERRGEDLDSGLARLRDAAAADHAGLSELLDKLVELLRHAPSEDDTAIVGLRWTD